MRDEQEWLVRLAQAGMTEQELVAQINAAKSMREVEQVLAKIPLPEGWVPPHSPMDELRSEIEASLWLRT